MLHLRKTKKFTFNQDAVRTPYNAHTTRYPERTQGESSALGKKGAKQQSWTPHPLGAKPRDVMEIPVLNNGQDEKTAHPTQKPEELIRRLIMACSNPGDCVLDPFGGSGTTYAVAEKLERRWLGIELDSDYVQVITKRLKEIEPGREKHEAEYRAAIEAATAHRSSVRSGRK